MKMLMRSLLVPAVAGALYAGPSLADPRDVLQPNHNQHGSIVRSTWTAGEVPATIAGRDTDVRAGMHAQTQAQMAAMDMGAEKASENQESNKNSKDQQASASSATNTKSNAPHLEAGDGTVESSANVSDSCGKTKRCNKDGERLHFSANVAQQLSGGTGKPAENREDASKAKPKAEQKGTAVAQHSDEKFHAPAKLSQQEQRPGDMPSAESHVARSAPELRMERFTSVREPGSLSLHRSQPGMMMRVPDKFYH